MNRIKHVEAEQHEWGSSVLRMTPTTLQAAQELIRAFPLEASRAELARLGRSSWPCVQFRKNGNDFCFVNFHADGTHGFYFFYLAASYTKNDISLQAACDLLGEYYARPHFGLFRELVLREDGMVFLGSTLTAKLLRLAMRI